MATAGIAPAAIVLTGGLSSRMGVDKASLVVDGEALADRAVRVLTEVGISDIAIAGSSALPDPAGVALGPMAGIVSGWAHVQTLNPCVETVVVLACDLPLITPDVIDALLAQAPHHDHGVVAHDGDLPQPLIAAYRARALDAICVAFADGERSVRRCFVDWDLGALRFERRALADVDTPSDLQGFSVQWPAGAPKSRTEVGD